MRINCDSDGVFVIILINKLLSLRGLLKLMRCEVSVNPNSCMKTS